MTRLARLLFLTGLLFGLLGYAVRAATYPASANNGGSTSGLSDSAGNTSGIPTNKDMVFHNGADLVNTANAVELVHVNSKIWHENNANQSFSFGTNTPYAVNNVTISTPTTTSPVTLPPACTESADQSVVLAGSGNSITDSKCNVFTITAGAQVSENGSTISATANVGELAYANHVVWQENTSNDWSSFDPLGGSTKTCPLTSCGTTPPPSGNFSVSGGYLIDPSGSKFIPAGTNIYDYNMPQILQDNTGYPIKTLFPKLNYIRVMVFPLSFNGGNAPTSFTYPNSADYKTIAGYCQATRIVCEFEDHASNGSFWDAKAAKPSYPPTGTLLDSILTFWKAMATQFKNNPYAWIGSLNELGVRSYSRADIGSQSDYHLALYNAIRGTGNNNIIDFCAGNGCGDVGTVGANALKPADYANMTNVMWLLHAYINDTEANALNTLNGTTAPNQHGGPGCYGWRCAQTIQSKDGVMPVIYNEFGSTNTDKNSTTGAGIAAAMTDLQAYGVGSASFLYFNPNGPSSLVGVDFTEVDNGGYTRSTMPAGKHYTLTPWGKIVAKLIAANPYPGGTGPAGPKQQ